MINQNITIINKLGLHARAASKLVNCASQFESDVFMSSMLCSTSLTVMVFFSFLAIISLQFS